MSSLDTIIDLLGRPEFVGGLITGAAVLLFVVAVGLGKGATGWGIAVSAATMAAVYATFGRRVGLTVGLGILMVGGWFLQRAWTQESESGNTAIAWLVVTVGAIVVTIRGGLPGSLWLQFGTPAFILIFGYWLARWKTLPQHTLVGPLFAISAFGVWITVPETSTARILLGVALVLLMATLRFIDLRVSLAGALLVAATLAWIAGDGGTTRPGSIVGAWGTAGILILLPWLVERGKDLPNGWVVGLHVGLVLVSTRVFGLWESAATAGAGIIATYTVVFAILLAMSPERASTYLDSGADRRDGADQGPR